jgi:hypothetical protein
MIQERLKTTVAFGAATLQKNIRKHRETPLYPVLETPFTVRGLLRCERSLQRCFEMHERASVWCKRDTIYRVVIAAYL